MITSSTKTLLAFGLWLGAILSPARPAHAATISWKGHTWNVTGGGMAGVCQGNAANVSVDTSGYLHMKISKSGSTWTAAEIFSTDKIGFGTYQWQIEGPTDKLDKNVVLGLFPYGPEGGLGESGNNEIDIEFARWGNEAWPNGNYTVWPPTGSTTGEHTFTFSLNGGTSITTRFTWSSSKIDFATLSGLVAVEASSGLIDSWTFAPTNPTTRITQTAMPLGMNLWCFDNPPSDGQGVEIIVRDFQFVPLGTSVDGGGGGGDGPVINDGSRPPVDAGGRDAPTGTDAFVGDSGVDAAGGAAGSGGATGGSSGTGGASSGTATGGSTGTGGASSGTASGGSTGTGGASSGTASGGSTGTGGASSGTASGGSPGTGGVSAAGTGGTSSVVSPSTRGSGGCGCRLAGADSARAGRRILLAAALLLAYRRRSRRS